MSASGVVDPVDALAQNLREGRPWISVGNFLAATRLLRKIPFERARERAIAGVRVAVIGNATDDYLADAITLGLAPRLACNTYVGEFDQWAGDLLAGDGPLQQFGADVVVLHLASMGLTAGGTRLAAVPGDLVRDALGAFASRSNALLVAILPEPLAEATGGSSEADRWYNEARAEIVAAVDQTVPGRSAVIDPLPALGDLARPWHSRSYWGTAKLPYHPAGCVAVGRRVAQAIENITYPRIKLVAVDCDDTLWSGLVGDVGPEGVGLSPFDGHAGHLQLQRLLKEASQRGILLVAVSKNEPENVAAVFRDRANEMILSEDDFVAFKVGWGSKSKALREVATDLRLGLDSFLFLDDSTFERGEVRAELPEVLTPDLPENPDDYAPLVARLGVLERPIVSDEDLARTQLQRHESLRDQARLTSGSPEAYLESLRLELIATPIDEKTLDRVAQLVGKTNQFNLTTRRHGRAELAAMAADPAAYSYAFRVSDRFGDAGLIGVVIANKTNDAEVELDSFLMSCRVMGRTVEDAMFEHLRLWLVQRGVTLIRAEYLPTKKNKPIAGLLPRLGFTPLREEAGRVSYERSTSSPIECRFVTIREGT